MAKGFSNLMERTNPQLQKPAKSDTMNAKESMPRHMIIKLLKSKDSETRLKATKEIAKPQTVISHRKLRGPEGASLAFSPVGGKEPLQVNALPGWTVRNERKIKRSSNRRKLGKFVASRPIFKEYLKNALQQKRNSMKARDFRKKC